MTGLQKGCENRPRLLDASDLHGLDEGAQVARKNV
jgi:hypothetical protein